MQPPAQAEEPRPPVCRRLFADDEDPDQAILDGVRDNMLNQINEEINRDLDDACKKYNFDFRTEQPLQGNWVWERLRTVEGSSRRPPPSGDQEVTVTPPSQEPSTPLKDPPAPENQPAPEETSP